MKQKAWIISVNMGYGHQRTVWPLRGLAKKGIINANDYSDIPKKDRRIWESSRKLYELASNLYRLPLLGRPGFIFFDKLQKILGFYPKRDSSKPNFQLRFIYRLIRKGWGRHLIEKLKKENQNLPIVSSFFTPAFMAEAFDYPGRIFCVICDADIARTWAPLKPQTSRIEYLVPNERTAERLRLYGVRSKKIFLTGYPLPLENIGAENSDILKQDLKRRLASLDPEKNYFEKYKVLVEKKLGRLPVFSDQPLALMFSIGGAGAQKEIALRALKSLRFEIWQGKVKVILSVGVKDKVKRYFEKKISRLRLKKENIEIIFEKDTGRYFEKFSQALRRTDVLWTKPSELSFYSALGVPFVIAPPIGSQEDFNMSWLLKSGFGILQEDPYYANQWLFDWRKRGYLAEAAMEGFVEGKRMGALEIEKIVLK